MVNNTENENNLELQNGKKSENKNLQIYNRIILLYGSECWTIDSTMRKKIYGYYTSLLRIATNISWKYKVTNTQLYWGMPKINEVIKLRRLRLAGHCIRHTDEIAHNLVIWKPKNGIRNRGRQPNTYIHFK